MVFKKRVSIVAPWWPSDMTKALQQRWWYSSTTYCCWCSMNKPPYYDFKLPCAARSSSQKTQPLAMFEDFIFLSDIFFPPSLCFPPFLLNSGSLKLPDGHSFQKEGKNDRNWGVGRRRRKREDQSVPDTCVTYFLNWWDVLRNKTLNGKGKRKNKIFCDPGRGCDSGRWACYVCLSFVGPTGFYAIPDG